ncbi:MAG: Na+/H+ antiporter NhaA [Alistipes sp.]|nr:Na+/H+ antiporter NhaA [Alistipes sp.]
MYGWVRGQQLAAARGRSFMNKPWAAGVVLLGCVVVAMLLANLPWTAGYYHHFLETELLATIASPDGGINWLFPAGMTVEKLINDGLMVIFFFTVGLEIKREIVCGELSSVRKAMLPVMAAAGGMAVPALIFAIFNHGTAAINGWGIPTATDIAFAIGILSILGDRVPISLKVFLTALAIADDLGAILVIALFYGGQVKLGLLAIACVILAGIYFIKRAGEKRMMFYLVPAIVVWALFYYSGVHSTISGVVMAMFIPMEPRFSREYYVRKSRLLTDALTQSMASQAPGDFPDEGQRRMLQRLSAVSAGSAGMSYRLEHALAPYVSFVIMPIFALANAGVHIPNAEYFNIFHVSPESGAIGLGIFFGLLLGKPVGIFCASRLAVMCKMGEMPSKSTWPMLFAVACLGGIGFTMSIFVDSLAFNDPDLIARGKIAILMGSAAAAVLGVVLISLLAKARGAEK